MSGSKPRRQHTRERFTTKGRRLQHRYAGWVAQAKCWGSIFITLYVDTVERGGLPGRLLTVMTRKRKQYTTIKAATGMGVSTVS